MPRQTARWVERDWYSVRAGTAADEAELLIYDRIGEGWFDEGVTAKGLVRELQGISASTLHVRINSPGGSVFDGLAIYNALVAHPARVETHIDGLAASIASVIAMAGDHISMAANALLMIHNPTMMSAGTADQLRLDADLLDKVAGNMAAVYADRSGLTADQVTDAMNAETWYNSAEALTAGLADSVVSQKAAAAAWDGIPLHAHTTAPPLPVPPPKEDPMPAAAADPVTREDLAELEARITAAQGTGVEVREPVPVRAAVRNLFSELVTAYGDGRRIIRAADMITSGNPGLTDPGRTSEQIIEYFDAHRYFCSHVDSIPFPESGTTHRLPRKTQRTQVGQAPEKAQPPSRAVQVDTVDFTGLWYKGWLDISYELIRTATPGAVGIAVDDMLEEAAVESELEFVAAVEAASTLSSGGPIDFTSYKTFVASVRKVVRELRAAAGKGTPKFALTSDEFDLLLGMTDGDGRRIMSTEGPSNADGSASLVSETAVLAQVMFFDSPHSAVSVAFNDQSLKRSELPPLQLSGDNVPMIGRDIAVLGNIMAVPRIPAGVLRLAAA